MNSPLRLKTRAFFSTITDGHIERGAEMRIMNAGRENGEREEEFSEMLYDN
jgi:hypothetical protein